MGILTNTGVFIRVSGTMNTRFAALEAKFDRRLGSLEAKFDNRLDLMQSDMKDLNKTMTALEVDVAVLKDKVGL